jgi:hypothetical protein
VKEWGGGKFSVLPQTDARKIPEEFGGVMAPQLIAAVGGVLDGSEWKRSVPHPRFHAD